MVHDIGRGAGEVLSDICAGTTSASPARPLARAGSNACTLPTPEPRCGSMANSSTSRTWCCTTPATASAPRPTNSPSAATCCAAAGASQRSRPAGRSVPTTSARFGRCRLQHPFETDSDGGSVGVRRILLQSKQGRGRTHTSKTPVRSMPSWRPSMRCSPDRARSWKRQGKPAPPKALVPPGKGIRLVCDLDLVRGRASGGMARCVRPNR
ncbi:hypothetical protein KGO5_02359 [Sinorhizobium sp. KGO-5]|nr:hypothetical protein KGO5_02359 [Sinorhizobium sp. KGO-5]